MKTSFYTFSLRKSGQYLNYYPPMVTGEPPRFVARFKHKGPITPSIFIKELIKNHTVEEYFEALENEDFSKRKAPLEILKAKNPEWYQEIKTKWLAKQK